MSESKNCVVALRDGNEVEWRVWFDGRLCALSWSTRGPALAYLNALVRGARKPEYAERNVA